MLKIHMKRNKDLSREILRFFSVGAACFLLGLIIQWISTSYFKLHYLIGYSFAVITTSLVNWLFNRSWTFKSTNTKKIPELLRHQAFNILTVLLSSFLFIIFVSGLGINYLISHTSIAVGMLFVNFLIQKFLVFQKDRR